MKTVDVMTKARATLVMAHPFFGSLALRLKLVPTPDVERGTCDGTTIRYNPEYVAKLTVRQAQGFIAHLVMHPALLQHTRRGERDKAKWNKACDYANNPILEEAGFELPEGLYNDPAYKGMTAEHIYSLLPDTDDKKDGDGNGQGGCGCSGDGQGGGKDNDPGGDGGVEDSPNSTSAGGSQSQQNSEEAEWKMALAQAAHVAKQAGKLPGNLERLIDETLEPEIPWRELLRRFMTEKANDDFSWARGNRRFIAQGLYLPSRTSEDAMGTMVVVIDTSGSIGAQELNEFTTEIKAICEDVKPDKIYVLYVDSRIAHIDEFGRDDELEFAPHGGGGTDFRPPFEWIKENQIDPRAFVYLTDGYGSFPDETDAPFPTLWVINNQDVTPPFGEHLTIKV